MEYSYKITMYTPLGPRHGNMYLKLSEKDVNGYIDILGSKGECHGKLLDDNNCRLKGYIHTIVRTIDFTAEGYFDNMKIKLLLKGQRHMYTINGTASEIPDISNTN